MPVQENVNTTDTASVAPGAMKPMQNDRSSFRQRVRKFAEEKVRPLVSSMDEKGELSGELIDDLFVAGLMGIEIPAAYGGQGRSFDDALLCIQELARIDPAVAVFVDVQNALVNTALLHWGTAQQKERYLKRLARDTVGAYSMSEEDAGSDAFALVTTAELSNGAYILNGRKKWTTNAVEAGLFLVFARLNPSHGAQNVTAFLIERASEGLAIGKRENKLGIRASSTSELILNHVRVAPENVLGPIAAGHRVAVETLNEGRIGIAAQMLGLAEGAFEAALSYAQSRKQFGQPIANFQAIQFQLANMATDIEAARLLVANASRIKDENLSVVERFRRAAMAKYFASQVAERVASQALEIFGGNGYLKDQPVEKFYRDAKIGKIYEGTTNMQLRTIATTILQP